MGSLNYLREKEMRSLFLYLTKSKSQEVAMSKPDMETYLLGRFNDRTIADALRVLKSQGLVVSSLAENNAIALGAGLGSCKLYVASAIPGAPGMPCTLQFGHDGPCRPQDNLLKSAMQLAMEKEMKKIKAAAPKFKASPLSEEPSSENGLDEEVDTKTGQVFKKPNLADFVTKGQLAKTVDTIKSKTLELFDETWDERESNFLERVDERITGMKLESGSPVIQTVSIVLPEKPGAGKTLARRPHMAFMKVLCLVRAGLIPMLVGPAGSGKTTIAEDLSEALELPYYFQSCTAGMSEGALTGRLLPLGVGGAMRYVSSPFLCGWAGEKNVVGPDGLITVVGDDESAGVVLLDEIDAADPNTTLILNAAFANKKMTVETRAASGLGTLLIKSSRSIPIMAANTFGTGMAIEYQGRGALDGAFLDRAYPVKIDYDPILEASIAGLPSPDVPLWKHAQPPSVAQWQDLAKWVFRVREAIAKAGVKKVWGTRALLKAKAARYGGIPNGEVKRDLLLGWPPDLAEKMLAL